MFTHQVKVDSVRPRIYRAISVLLKGEYTLVLTPLPAAGGVGQQTKQATS